MTLTTMVKGAEIEGPIIAIFYPRNVRVEATPATSEAIFPALIFLSLGCISQKNAAKALVHTLSLRGLSHLALHQCLSIEDFLREIAASASGYTLKLFSPEYTCGFEYRE